MTRCGFLLTSSQKKKQKQQMLMYFGKHESPESQ